jgi:hypothetical protein
MNGHSTKSAETVVPMISTSIKHRSYHLYGPNAELVRWSVNSQLANRIFETARITEDDLFLALGGDWRKDRILHSKELINRLWNAHQFLGPYPFLDTLSTFEFAGEFYPQYRDHVCHQLKVYLLGLYAYDNCPLLQDNLDQSFQLPALHTDQASSLFALYWLVTSLYHDVGYVLENEHAGPNQKAWESTRAQLNHVLESPLAYTSAFQKQFTPAQEQFFIQQHEIFRPKIKHPDAFVDDNQHDLLCLLDKEAARAGLVATDGNVREHA